MPKRLGAHQLNDFDQRVRFHVYDAVMRAGAPPSIEAVAAAMASDAGEVADAFRRLADAHVLVLQRDHNEILMAPPFSAVPTPFLVETPRVSAYGNCIWDALGIAAMLRSDARIVTSCGDCGTAAEVFVDGGKVRGEGVMHFAVPARKWWDDIVFT
jgi:hypothetical protein